jgi:transcriptional regulator with XRE-family HTH domain
VRVRIGQRLRELRETRRFTQRALAARLVISQPHLSQIERGAASLTAEQFLEVLQLFNVPATVFSDHESDPAVEIQSALARLGASNLYVGGELVPSELMSRVGDVTREALINGSSRLVVALAPVLAQHAADTNLSKVAYDLYQVGLRQRLYWVAENTLHALRTIAPKEHPGSRRALETTLALVHGLDVEHAVDVLDRNLSKPSTIEAVRSESSAISKRWNVVTRLQPTDFAEALEEARAAR